MGGTNYQKQVESHTDFTGSNRVLVRDECFLSKHIYSCHASEGLDLQFTTIPELPIVTMQSPASSCITGLAPDIFQLYIDRPPLVYSSVKWAPYYLLPDQLRLK